MGLRELGTRALVLRLALLGAFSGFAAWALVWAGSLLFEIGRPTPLELLLAIPRGALFGLLAALLLRAYWSRSET